MSPIRTHDVDPRRRRAATPQRSDERADAIPARMLGLQQAAGNRAVQRLVADRAGGRGAADGAASTPVVVQGNWLGDLADAASGVAGDAAEWVSDTAGDVAETAGNAWDAASEAAGQAWDTASGAAGQAWDAVSGAAGAALDAVSGAAGAAWEGVRDITDTRDNEEYLDAIEDLEAFRARPHEVENYQSPDTNIGGFNAAYHPSTGQLTITVRCKFAFHNGSPADFPSADAADLQWDDAGKEDYQRRWLEHCTNTWSGKHTFHCQRDWWEKLQANVAVNFIAVEEDPHFNLNVTKIPPGEFATSSVRRPTEDMFGRFTPGTGTFDSNDLDAVDKGASDSSTQTPAGHEAGHMLGLDDEYESSPGGVSHSDICDHEFGHAVEKADDGRIMASGDRVDPEHGVTFLTALQEATDEDWGPSAKAPKPVPAGAPPHPLGNPPENEGG